ncbi:M23 family metallopeptidase [Salinisphaera hydrothermalis]|uniref:M23 family metallopeptidase n=1 Tax=Salinisphaera hydrothermalis TaxID=563188 RepID=UPI0018DE2F9C|nr:M23 family metallopeptidase [Salinisphaera hydrothermalis]
MLASLACTTVALAGPMLPRPPIHPQAWQRITVRAGDTLSGLLQRRGIDADAVLRARGIGPYRSDLNHIQPGQTLELDQASSGQLLQLRYPLGTLRTLIVQPGQGPGLRASIDQLPATRRQVLLSGRIHHSLSQSLSGAGAPPSVIRQVIKIYHSRVHLKHDIRPGGRFSLLYRVVDHDGRRIKVGPVEAVSLTTAGHQWGAYRAIGADQKAHYYNAKGQSYEPTISRHPVDYTRISSGFSLHRMDPAVHFVHPHYGVDMAAPLGTPVHAAGAGRITFVGWERGYGRLVKMQNMDGYATRYAHLHSFAKGLHVGERVARGQLLGTVGNTGWSTGPHLLFEIRKNGVPHNPMTMALPHARSLKGSRLAQFQTRVARLHQLLNTPASGPDHRQSWVSSPICSDWLKLAARLTRNPAGRSQQAALDRLSCIGHNGGVAQPQILASES